MQLAVEEIAHVCHEANRAIQVLTGDPAPSPLWADAPAWQRDAAVAGVREAVAGADPELLHEAWCEAKRADGWVHGPVKNADAKTHPCLLPYAELPEAEQIKDRLFTAIVNTLRSQA